MNPNQLVVQANIKKIVKARTVVRQMKTLGKAKKLAKAEAKLAKLKEKEVQARGYIHRSMLYST